MDQHDYKALMDQVGLFGTIVEDLPLRDALELAGRAEAIGFLFVAPFDYQRGLSNTRDAKELLNALMKFQTAVRTVKARAVAEGRAPKEVS